MEALMGMGLPITQVTTKHFQYVVAHTHEATLGTKSKVLKLLPQNSKPLFAAGGPRGYAASPGLKFVNADNQRRTCFLTQAV
eukprot:1152450-Pelagomonas_calceolata.AAC.3